MKLVKKTYENFIGGLHGKAEKQGQAYTALDAMKLFAIVNMTIDHLGAYLFPEIEWLRALGRITFPVWFFLVGYSRSRTLGKPLWIYALILVAIHPFVGLALFPVNALVTIILCRLVLNFLTDRGMLPDRIYDVIIACALGSLFTLPVFEYGSIAILYAVFGRMVREREMRHFKLLTVSCYVLFVFWQLVPTSYDMVQSVYIIIGTAWVVGWLARCPNHVVWPDWRASRYKRLATLLSRNTLLYYFYHRIILQVAGALILGKSMGIEW